MEKNPVMPSEVSPVVGAFDHFAEAASKVASRAWFFCFCVLLVVLWAPSIILLRDIDTWQLIINTLTTIVTFLMVALLQNSQTRADQALQHKLNAVAAMLAHLATNQGLQDEASELRDAVGLESRESTSNNAAAAPGGKNSKTGGKAPVKKPVTKNSAKSSRKSTKAPAH